MDITKEEAITPPNTPEKLPVCNIKERLNLHVKRRLQQETSNQDNQLQQQHIEGTTSSSNCYNNIEYPEEDMRNKHSEKQVKARKSYQKRTGKTSPDGTAVRKYKRKHKHQILESTAGNKVLNVNPAAGVDTDINPSAAGGSGNGDGDGSHDGQETESKLHEKERCSGILGMVLGAKKRALMQNPDVQIFLQQIMKAIKN